jgi:hypothetical protein
MLEKLKNLNFISLREIQNLDRSEIFYLDYSLTENNEQAANVFTKTVCCGSIEMDDINELPNIIKTIFIEDINQYFKPENVINIDSKLIDKIDNIISLTMDNFIATLSDNAKKFANTEKFVIVSDNLKDKKILHQIYGKDYNLNTSSKIENEIIFGYKTGIDQPGFILLTNEDGLKDNKDIKFAITGLGFYPESAYFKIKIN